MNAENLLKYLKKCVEDLGIDGETIIIPTKNNPNELQNNVSFFVMENVNEGQIPRFRIDVKDVETIRKIKNDEKNNSFIY